VTANRASLVALYDAALRRVDPHAMVTGRLTVEGSTLVAAGDGDPLRIDLDRFREVRLIGVGKAAVPMGRGVEQVLGERLTGGVAVTKLGHAGDGLRRVRLLEAEHPVPGELSAAAGRALADECRRAREDTLLIGVISGGGSALLTAPAEGLTLADKQDTTRLLLAAGATIGEVNCVRKHLSALKGGRMAELIHPATSLNLILSDVVGDRLDTIASGLTAPDPSTFADAATILHRYGLWQEVPAAVRARIDAGQAGAVPDTPTPGHRAFAATHNLLLGSGRSAVGAAAAAARGAGYDTLVLSTQLTGEAREIAAVFYALARDLRSGRLALRLPACIVAGGETTVTVTGSGNGGRCQEMALAFLVQMAEDSDPPHTATLLAAGTDGNDGPNDAAGAFADAAAVTAAARLDPRAALADNDSHGFGAAAGTLFAPGPTNTNVSDLYLLTVDRS
jgi:hydroxypyruvate reductase